MSSAAEALGKKIASAGELGMIVRSMKALAASSIGQYERAVASLIDYHRTVECGLSACLRVAELTCATPARAAHVSVGAIIFGSDQGLVGRFNEALFEFVLRTLRSLGPATKRVWAVGDRMHEIATDGGSTKPVLLPVPNSVNGITGLVDELLIAVETARERDRITDIYVFQNRPVPGAYEPTSAKLLPLDTIWQAQSTAMRWPTRTEPQIIGEIGTALHGFIHEYLFVVLFRACAESLMSENATRLAAMQRAEKNIAEIREDLSRRFHRSRQESIDEELFEVISGYESSPPRRTALLLCSPTMAP